MLSRAAELSLAAAGAGSVWASIDVRLLVAADAAAVAGFAPFD
jgi:hypothetical protein